MSLYVELSHPLSRKVIMKGKGEPDRKGLSLASSGEGKRDTSNLPKVLHIIKIIRRSSVLSCLQPYLNVPTHLRKGLPSRARAPEKLHYMYVS